MMKQHDRIAFAGILALTMLLTACGGSRAATAVPAGNAALPAPSAPAETVPPSAPPAEAETEAPAPTEAPAETEPPEASPAPATDYEAVYRPILDQVFTGITEGFDWDREYVGLTGIVEMANMLEVNEMLRSTGYAITDFSGDGVPELALGSIANDEKGEGSILFALFTCAEEQPKLVFEGWYRNRFEWMGGNRFFYTGSGGAAYGLYGDCRLSPDATEIIWDDFYFTTVTNEDTYEIGWFYNTTGEFEGEGSTAVTEEAFLAGWDALYERVTALPMRSFAEYGGAARAADAPVRAVWESELPGGHAEYTSVVSGDPEYAVRLAFVTAETVTDVEFVSLRLENMDADGNPTWSTETLYSQPVLTPEKPLVAELSFPGDLPAYGIRYTDPSGTMRFFTLSQSGFDGSLVLSER